MSGNQRNLPHGIVVVRSDRPYPEAVSDQWRREGRGRPPCVLSHRRSNPIRGARSTQPLRWMVRVTERIVYLNTPGVCPSASVPNAEFPAKSRTCELQRLALWPIAVGGSRALQAAIQLQPVGGHQLG